MFTECRHILPTGRKCKSPAMHNHAFCYFHSGLRRYPSTRVSSRIKPLRPPSLEKISGIQVAITDVLNALMQSRINRRRAALCLHGIQVAIPFATGSPIVSKPTKATPRQSTPAPASATVTASKNLRPVARKSSGDKVCG
jgi:hypothetical protein